MIGFIGGGKMAEALIKGMTLRGNKNIFAFDILENKRCYLETVYGISTAQCNKKVVDACNIIILAVKPQDMAPVLDEIALAVTEDKIIISIAAGLTLDFFHKKLKTKKIVRAMPNAPVLVQEGMTALSFGEHFPESDRAMITELFMSVGKVLIIPEEKMNAVSALASSGPAFIALFAHSLIDAGIGMGLTNEQATHAALQTCIGTAALFKAEMSPEQICATVASPGGITVAGLRVFEEKKLKEIVADALKAAQKKGEDLAHQ